MADGSPLQATITNADGEVIFTGDLATNGFSDEYARAAAWVVRANNPSTSLVQRKLGLAYNPAARLMERMEADGLVSARDAGGKRALKEGPALELVRASLGIAGGRADTPTREAPQEASFATSPDVMTSAANGRLRSFVERIERLEEDKAAISGDLKEVYAEAKGEGFDTKILRKVIRLRGQDKAKRDEEEALLDLYLAAIGELP